jgi:lipoprotein-anchoring transpeptidase ErfK/SrfK
MKWDRRIRHIRFVRSGERGAGALRCGKSRLPARYLVGAVFLGMTFFPSALSALSLEESGKWLDDSVTKTTDSVKEPGVDVIKVSVSAQCLDVYRGNKKIKRYPVSTSKYGIGSKSGSNRTPLGAHRIVKKIGRDAPEGTIFEGGGNTGRIAKIRRTAKNAGKEEDLVVTRILRLEGVEEGVNKGQGIDSYDRCIYIHGTPDEYAIGRPASHGCIRMKNKDVIELFEMVKKGDRVEIVQ